MLTSSSSIASLVSQARSLSDQQTEIARELSTGSRLTQLSNDPMAAAATVRLSSAVAQAGAAAAAIQTTQARMNSADAALGSVVTQVTTAISTAVAATNDTENTNDRSSAAMQLQSILGSVVALANSSYDGTYLFGGTAVHAEPFSQDGTSGQVTYNGDHGTMQLQVQGMTMQTSASGAMLFGTGSTSVFGQMQSIITTLQGGDAPTADQVTGLRSALQALINGRSTLDNSESRLRDAGTYTATGLTNLQAEQTSVAASDPVALATALSNAATQRSALLSSLAMLGKNSLFDYLSS